MTIEAKRQSVVSSSYAKNGFAPRAALLNCPGGEKPSSESSDFYLFLEAVRTFTGITVVSRVLTYLSHRP